MSAVRSRRKAAGFTLVEVMVSLAIGLFVVGAVLLSYLGTGASGTQRAAVGQMTEDAQIALSQISRDLQMAGYVDVANISVSPSGDTSTFVRPGANFRPVFGCNGGFANARTEKWSAVCAPGAAPGQALEVSYQTTTWTSVISSGLPLDCIGNTMNATASFAVTAVSPTYSVTFVSNRYFIAQGTGRPELHCASSVTNATNGSQPIVDNVQDLRFWFGVAPGWSPSLPETRHPARFLPPQDMGTDDWHRVVSVRVCLLMRTERPVLGENAGTFTYRDCLGNDGLASPDGRIYRAFHTTVALRNRAGF